MHWSCPLEECGYHFIFAVSYIQNICAGQELLTATEGYLATPGYPASLALPPTLKCTASISQPQGWFIKIYLLDYAKVRVKVTSQGCESQVTFGEKTTRLSRQQGHMPQVSLCLDSDLTRNQLLYKSVTSSVDVTFTGPVRIGRGQADKAGILLLYKGRHADCWTKQASFSYTKVSMQTLIKPWYWRWTQTTCV